MIISYGKVELMKENGLFRADSIELNPGYYQMKVLDINDAVLIDAKFWAPTDDIDYMCQQDEEGNTIECQIHERTKKKNLPPKEFTSPKKEETPSMNPSIPARVVEQIILDDVFLSGNALRFRVSPGNHADTRIKNMKFQVSLIGYTGTGTLELYRDTLSVSNLVASTPISPVTDPTSSYLSQDITLIVDGNQNAVTEQHSSHEFIVVIRGLDMDAGMRNIHWNMRLESLELDIGGNTFNASDYGNIAELPFHAGGTR